MEPIYRDIVWMESQPKKLKSKDPEINNFFECNFQSFKNRRFEGSSGFIKLNGVSLYLPTSLFLERVSSSNRQFL